MNNPFENIRQVRRHLLNHVSELTVDQLNRVPPGFNNNIIWNLAHLVAAQQGICHEHPGLDPIVGRSFIEAYKPGTKPVDNLNEKEIEMIKSLLFSTIDQFEADYQKGLFINYDPRPTRYGVTLNSIEDALQFLLFHEGLHTGYIWALKRTLLNS
jgi:hypothetical protein